MFQIINLASGIGGNVVSTNRTEAAAIAAKRRLERLVKPSGQYRMMLIIVAK